MSPHTTQLRARYERLVAEHRPLTISSETPDLGEQSTLLVLECGGCRQRLASVTIPDCWQDVAEVLVRDFVAEWTRATMGNHLRDVLLAEPGWMPTAEGNP